jgi:hypothetical protein
VLDQAVQAFNSARELYTKAEHPQEWAEIGLNLAEANLAAGRFDECLAQIASAKNETLSESIVIGRDSMQLACEWGSANKSAAQTTEKALLAKVTGITAGAWTVSGLNHVLLNSSVFATGRASWIALFTSLQNGDSSGMSSALRQLEPILQ